MDPEKKVLVTDVAEVDKLSVQSQQDGVVTNESVPALAPLGQSKIREIELACQQKDIPKLRRLAESPGGFLSDDTRRRAWPILLGLTTDETAGLSAANNEITTEKTIRWQDLTEHGDEEQVDKDVERSFLHYPLNQTEEQLKQNRANLRSLIVQVLRRYPYLNYYQGYHDICQVFLLVLGLDLGAPAVARLSVLRIRDFMLPTLDASSAQLHLVPNLLRKAAPKLWQHIVGIMPWFALPATITMFAHIIERYHAITRLFDVTLAKEPAFNIYLFSQTLLDRQEEIFELDDRDMLLVTLGKVPRNIDLDKLISDSVALFDRFPPQKLATWNAISDASVLKTARDVDHPEQQSMTDGHAYFEQLDKEITIQKEKEKLWDERKKKVAMAVNMLWLYRRPAGAVGMALVVGLAAYQLRREPAALNHIIAFFSRLYML